MNISICLLQAIAFLDLLAVGLIVSLIPSHVRKMGANHIYVGLLGSIYAGFQLGSGPLLGSLSDIKGRKSVLMFTLLICAGAYTLIGITDSVIIILILRAVLGLFKQTQMLTKALVPDFEKNVHLQSDVYGKMAAISGAGITLGPLMGGHIIEDYPDNGFALIAAIVGICFVVNSGLAYFLPNTKKKQRRKPKKIADMNIFSSAFTSLKQSVFELGKIDWSNYWDIFMFKALIAFAMGIYYTNYTTYLRTEYDLSPKYIGYVISFQGVIGSICSFFMGCINNLYIKDVDYSQRNFHVFVVLSCSLLGMILSSNIYLYVIWVIPLAVGNAIGRLITLEMILKRCHGDHRATLIGASNSVRSLTGVVAPMVAGIIGEFYGVSYVICASLFSTLLGFIMSYFLIRNKLKAD